MSSERRLDLAEVTTLRLGGQAERFVDVEDTQQLVEVVEEIGRDGLLVLGDGSNVVIADAGVDVPVVRVATRGVVVVNSTDATVSGVELAVAAGESWDELVARAVAEGWSGIEALSGIPGRVGATPIQNVGAYGQEVSDTITGVEVFDRLTTRRVQMTPAECDFGYRTSAFKRERDRFVVVTVHFRLKADPASAPVQYAELARTLGVNVGSSAPLAEVRTAVLTLRRRKGMVLDPNDHDTWSAGSFFTNPILETGATFPPDAPRWVQPDGRVKTSAAWLIEQAGFAKGFGREVGRGSVTLSAKHALALTNRGGATTEELLSLARIVRQGVHDQFGITLHPEPTLIGVHL
jgi:UDP-N-acetylmuramate dehydrogenase